MPTNTSGVPTITQAQLTALQGIPGANVAGIKVGDPISELVPVFAGPGTNPITGGNWTDPSQDPSGIMQQLISGGWLQQGSDAQGNASWTVGPQWEALNPKSGSGLENVSGVSLGLATPWSQVRDDPGMKWEGIVGAKYGAANPLTGLQQIINPGHIVGQREGGNQFLNQFIESGGLASLLAAPLFAPLAAEMGPLFGSLFKTAGTAIEGQQQNPLASLVALVQSQLGSG